MLTEADRQYLIAATATNRKRMADHERDSWPVAERDDGPEHIGNMIADWMRLRGLSGQYDGWRARHGKPEIAEPALTHCGEGV